MSTWIKILLASVFCGLVIAVVGVLASLRLVQRKYTLKSNKIEGQHLRIVLLSDLHATRYGKRQEKLLAQIDRQRPDLLVLTGDIVAEDKDRTPALELLEALARAYPCYYVTGNHEYRSGKPDEVRELVRSFCITVLQGESVICDTPVGTVRISGVDDPHEGGMDIFLAQAKEALADISEQDDVFTLFLCHHPELSVSLAQTYHLPFDLALSGHAHGGQWRIPGLINGVYAPHQGIFPKYAGGCYDLGGGRSLVVSRGLSKSFPIPRIFNPPELVTIDVKKG